MSHFRISKSFLTCTLCTPDDKEGLDVASKNRGFNIALALIRFVVLKLVDFSPPL